MSMTGRTRSILLAAGLMLLIPALLAACAGDDAGLTRAEVEEIVRSEMAAAAPQAGASTGMTPDDVEGIVNDSIAEMSPPEPGLTRAEVEEIVGAAIAGIAQTQPGLSADEAERIARAAIAAVPSKATPAEYTQHVVDNAIARYQAQGLDATLAHYNSPQSVDGQWYVFIIDENDMVIGHPEPERVGLDVKGWVGTDVNGYEFGTAMLAADEGGKWVSYVYRNPASGGLGTGDFEFKNVWVERHDGLLFASGWYIDAAVFTEQLVSVAVDKYRDLGLAETMVYFASPGSALAGLEEAIAYYNSAETIDGHWFAFIGDPDGKIAGHSDPSMIGGDVQDLFGTETFDASEAGVWVESESLRVLVATYDGHTFGAGWSRDE